MVLLCFCWTGLSICSRSRTIIDEFNVTNPFRSLFLGSLSEREMVPQSSHSRTLTDDPPRGEFDEFKRGSLAGEKNRVNKGGFSQFAPNTPLASTK